MTELIFEMKKIFLNKKVRSKIIVLIQSISEKKVSGSFYLNVETVEKNRQKLIFAISYNLDVFNLM